MDRKVKFWDKVPESDEKLLLGRMAEVINFYLEHTEDTDLSDAIKLNHETYLTSPYEELPPGFYSQLDTLLATITDNRELTEFPTVACLCIQADEQSVLHGWHGLVISVALEHLRLFSNASRIASAVNAYRLFVSLELKKYSSEINKHVPSASLPLFEIVAAIDSYFEQPDLILPLKRRLQPIRRIIEDVYKQELKNQRSRGVTPPIAPKENNKNEEKDTVTRKQAPVDEEEAPYIEFVETFTEPSAKTVDSNEFRADNAPRTTFIQAATDSSVSKHIANSAALSAIYARNVAHQIERREKSLITAWPTLTEREVSILIQAIQEHYQTYSAETLVIYLMLVTGRRLEELCSAKNVTSINALNTVGNAYTLEAYGNWYYWMYLPDLPQHKQERVFHGLLNQKLAIVFLPIPYFIPHVQPPPYIIPSYTEDLKISVDAFLAKINKAFSVRLTSTRIADYLSYFLHRNGVDDVVIAHLTGNPSIQPAGIYYQQFNGTQLQEAYNLFITAALKPSIPDLRINPIDPSYLGGSRLQVKDKAIAMLFSHLESQLSDNHSLIEFHNSYTLYVLHLLNFATGHRPVNDPFEDLRSIDLYNAKIFISDKEVRDVDASRTIVLPKVAIEQINAYLAHLEILKDHLTFINPLAINYLEKAMNGTVPFLFFFNLNQGNAILSITPSLVKKMVSDFFGLPLNWNRHYLRTFLSNQGITGETIDTWMGHAKPGQEGLAKYSGLSMSSLKKVADCIQKEMENLEIKKLDGWGAYDG